MKKLAEVRNDYTDEETNHTYIDGYLTEDDNENGFSVAVVSRDTLKVVFLRNDYRKDKLAIESINEVLDDLFEERKKF